MNFNTVLCYNMPPAIPLYCYLKLTICNFNILYRCCTVHIPYMLEYISTTFVMNKVWHGMQQHMTKFTANDVYTGTFWSNYIANYKRL